MANALYPKWKETIINAFLSSATIKALLVDTASYTYSTSHQFLSDIPSGMRVATSAALSSKTFTAGVFDSADPSWTAVTGAQSEAIVLFKDTGSAATSDLIVYIDTGVTGLPVTPNGGDINITVNASGWFAI